LVISRKGLGVTRAVVQGKTGHAGIDHDQGVNAFTALCRAVVAIEDLEQRFAGLSVSAGGQVEVSPQELNVIPNEARCDLEWRFSQPGMGADMLSALERLAHELTQHTKANVSLASEIECHPMAATPESMLLYERYAKAASQLGLKVAPVATPGISDANIVAHLCPVCLDGVGPEGGNFHTDQEYLLVNTIAERAALNTVALCSLLSHAD
jgi:glutamate carboxypeptidase